MGADSRAKTHYSAGSILVQHETIKTVALVELQNVEDSLQVAQNLLHSENYHGMFAGWLENLIMEVRLYKSRFESEY